MEESDITKPTDAKTGAVETQPGAVETQPGAVDANISKAFDFYILF